MSFPRHRNIGAYIDARRAINSTSITAGGANDNVAVNGISLNRLTQLNDEGEGAALLIAITTTLANTQTALVTCQFEDSADGSVWAAFGAAQSRTIGPASGAQTFAGVIRFDMGVEGRFGLDGARQFVRCVITVNLSAGAADTAEHFAIWVIAGQRNLEVTPLVIV